MRSLQIARWAAAILLGVQMTAAAAAGDDATPRDNRPPGWKPGWRGPFKDAFEAPKPKAAPRKEAAATDDKPSDKQTPKKVIVTAKGASTTVVDEAAAERAREEAALLRRLKACDRLREIALERDDSELMHKAELLDERARTAYAQRSTNKAASAEAENDEKLIERMLRAGGASIEKGAEEPSKSRRASISEGNR